MKKIFYFLFVVAAVMGCKEVYEPNISSPPTGYLVVDGFINSAEGVSTISLTRTTKLIDEVAIIYEFNAQVSIESDNNESYPLFEGLNGTYTSAVLNLNPASKYRIKINTQDGKAYVSEFTAVKNTPAIDSISWQREDGGVQTYINTHDPQNTTKYYQWKYEETWQIQSFFLSTLKYIYDPVTGNITSVDWRDPLTLGPDTTITNCWQSYTSRNIIIGSSEKLSEARIYLPLTYIEPASVQLSVLYSVELKQYALSLGAYMFYDQMRKNTEQLGSIFDAQPSELQGNIQCVTDPSEVVIGYVEVTEEQTKRIFISNKQVEDWGFNLGCSSFTIDNHPDSILKYGMGLMPTYAKTVSPFGGIVDFYASQPVCVDCTLRGSNKKPSFWP